MADFLDTIELSVRATNVLRNQGITTESQFMQLTRPVFVNFKAAGVKTWREIEEIQTNIRGNIRERRRESTIGRAALLLRDLNAISAELAREWLFVTRGTAGRFRLGRFITKGDFEIE